MPGFLQARGQPPLRVFDDHLADLAQPAGTDNLTRLFDQRIPRVIVRQAVEQSGAFKQRTQFRRLGKIEGRGLVRDDVEAMFQRRLGRGEVQMVRGDDGDEVHAPVGRQRGFSGHHFLERAVATFRRKEQVGTRILRPLRVAAERAADQFDLAVEGGRHAMHGPDEGAASSADHAHADFTVRRTHFFFFLAKAASKATALGSKSSARTKPAASVAPWMRSMRMSSHSTESGPR